MIIKYIAYPWPEYQEYMGEEWFREECYYCADKDVYFIPINRVNSTSAELKESNDKDIRKDIIRSLKIYIKCIKDGYDAPSAKDFVVKEIEKQIAWLEKQGEQKPANSYCQENCKGFQETGKCFADGDCKAKREAEIIDKVKPKFKVGDWICNDMCDVHIASIENGMYYFDEGDGLSIVFVDEHYHLWTIKDAKEGDVLYAKGFYGDCVFIFNGLDKWKFYEPSGDRAVTTGHCCIIISSKNIEFAIQGPDCVEVDTVNPATKEQRELLFQRMKGAGYTFDFKNKELKKIKNDIEIPFGAKDSELQEATYFIPKGFHAEIDDDKVVIKKGEKPAEWSEDDERIKKRLINLVNEVYNNTNYITFLEHKELLAWLEKLDDNAEL